MNRNMLSSLSARSNTVKLMLAAGFGLWSCKSSSRTLFIIYDILIMGCITSDVRNGVIFVNLLSIYATYNKHSTVVA